MKKTFQLIFLFLIIIDFIQSIVPKTDKYELPIISSGQRNRTYKRPNRPNKPNEPHRQNTTPQMGKLVAKSIREGNYRYFIFDTSYLKKPKRGPKNILYFEINSPRMSNIDISYTYLSNSMTQLDLNHISKNRINYWNIPNFINSKPNPKNYKQYQYSVNLKYNEAEKSKKTLIIKVISPYSTDNITCVQVYDIMNQMKDRIRPEMHKNDRGYHHEYEKMKHDWNKGMRKKFKFGKKFFKRFYGFRVLIAIILSVILNILLVLYCLVNRRKKNVAIIYKNPGINSSLSNYRNI